MNARRIVVALAPVLLCTACTVFKARPAEDSGFLPYPELLKPMPERAPFNAVYVPDPKRMEELRLKYPFISVLPINTLPAEAKIRAKQLPSGE